MTQQEIFDRVCSGLASQCFARSTQPTVAGGCAYRGEHGRRCAIGWLLDDSKYDPSMEGYSVGGNMLPWSEIAPGLGDHEKDLLSALQEAHDDADGTVDMQERLRVVAEEYGLQLPGCL